MDVSSRGMNRTSGSNAGRRWTLPIAQNGRRLELECLETLDELVALKEEWQALERRTPEPFTYFQSFDWCISWCRAFLDGEAAADQRPSVYVLWDGGECLMIWPLMTRRVAGTVRAVVPLSAPMNQYAALVYDPARFDLTLGKRVFDGICGRGEGDAICLDHVPQTALLARIIGGRGVSPLTEQQSSILDLTDIADWESHHRALPKKQRLQRNSRRNRLEKLGRLDYRVLTQADAEYADHVTRCIAMKQDWLKGTGRLGRDLFDPRFAAFLRGLGQGTGPDEGCVYLHALTLDGVPIAMELGMRFRQDYYCFLGAIDLAYQQYSPGKVQMESAQRWAIESGIHRFDFLNDPSAYKSSWTNANEPLTALYVPLTALGQVYCRQWMAGLRPRLRALYHGLGPAWRGRFRHVLDRLQALVGRAGGSMSLVLCCMP